MAKQTIVELVNDAPVFTESMAFELADLAQRYICIPAMFQHILSQASATAFELKNQDFGTEKGRYEAAKLQGTMIGKEHAVNTVLAMMMAEAHPHDQSRDPDRTLPGKEEPKRRVRPRSSEPARKTKVVTKKRKTR